MNIIVTDKISAVCPEFVGAAVEAHVQNTAFCPELWDEINALCEDYRTRFTTVSIKEMAAIEATRRVYRACGKDPSRYRPAAEALIRRVVQGKELYQIDTLVDLINLASMKYGYSIGGFDADKFVGDTLALGVGEPGEPYEGIGRGMLNIEGMPVYRDAKGPIATPTSDEERTKFTEESKTAQININAFVPEMPVEEAVDWMASLLKKYAQATDVETAIYDPNK